MRSVINVACNIDDNYASHAAVTLVSVLDNLSSSIVEVQIYIFYKSLSEQNIKLLRLSLLRYKNCSLNFIKVLDNAITRFKGKGYISNAAFFRVFLPYFLPLDKILYIDSDIIFQTDISNLWNIRLGKHFLAAIKLFDRRASRYYRHAYRLNCKNTDIFNSGVMLMNLKRMRRYIKRVSLVNFINTNSQKLVSCDQDVLNAFYCKNWLRIPVEYNVDAGVYLVKSYKFSNYTKKEFDNVLKKPKVLHFTGPDKPWNFECNHPKKDAYFKYQKRTSFVTKSPFRFKAYLSSKIKGFCYKLVLLFPDKIYRYIYDRYL